MLFGCTSHCPPFVPFVANAQFLVESRGEIRVSFCGLELCFSHLVKLYTAQKFMAGEVQTCRFNLIAAQAELLVYLPFALYSAALTRLLLRQNRRSTHRRPTQSVTPRPLDRSVLAVAFVSLKYGPEHSHFIALGRPVMNGSNKAKNKALDVGSGSGLTFNTIIWVQLLGHKDTTVSLIARPAD